MRWTAFAFFAILVHAALCQERPIPDGSKYDQRKIVDYPFPSNTYGFALKKHGNMEGAVSLPNMRKLVDSLPATYYPSSSYADGYTLTINNVAGVVSLPSAYTVTFDLNPTAGATTEWVNVICLRATGTASGYGGRLPLIGMKPGEGSKLYLSAFVSGTTDIFFLTDEALNLNAWSTLTVVMDMTNKFMQLSVSGGTTFPTKTVSFATVTQTTWSSVQVYASYPEVPAAAAKIRNLVIVETTASPTALPTALPTASPTASPTALPTASPTSLTASPTVAPTVAPTASPTTLPTALPTRKPSMHAVRQGAYVYDTLHHGPQCRTHVAEFSIASLKLNQCLPSDVGNPRTAHAVTWQQTDAPHRFTCSVGQRKFSVINTQYAAADSTCSREPTWSLVSRHDYLCSKDPATGMFRHTHCGYLASNLATQDSLVLKVYNNERCTADSKTRGYLLGVCNRMYDTNTKFPLVTYAKLAVAITYTQGAAQNSGSSRWAQGTVVWVVEQQIFKSDSCTGAPARTVKAEYASDVTCKQDSLRPTAFYTLATLANAESPLALSNPTWLFDPSSSGPKRQRE